MNISRKVLLFGSLLMAAGFVFAQSFDLAPTGAGIGTLFSPGVRSNVAGPPRVADESEDSVGELGNGIFYHGGPVMTGPKNVYYIWYGGWTANTAKLILPDLANGMGGSPYFNINTTYHNWQRQKVSNVVTLAGQVDDNYSHGVNITSSNVQQIVAAQNPTDTNGVYFVLTSQDVNLSGFCTSFCGWHTHANINGKDIKYAFVGNAAKCPSSCAAQTTSPNNNVGADGMASVIAHELEEAATDPDLNAWYDRSGAENADKCAWNFGTTYTTPNGAKANMKLGGRDFLIQQNWLNVKGGMCAQTYP